MEHNISSLSFATQVTYGGVQEPTVIGAQTDWKSAIHDVRASFAALDPAYVQAGNIVTQLEVLPKAILLSVVRPVPGRSEDNMCVWIHVPSCSEIGGLELVRVLDSVKKIVSRGEFDDQARETLLKMSREDYTSKTYTPTYRPSAQQGYAAVGAPRFTVEEILGPGRYQPEYSRYRSVFIMDRPLPLRAGVVNLNDTLRLVEQVAVMPPTPEAVVAAFGPGVKICDAQGSPFTVPKMEVSGTQMRFRAVREGYRPKPFAVTATAEADGMPLAIPADSTPWMKIVDLKDIWVLDRDKGTEIPLRSVMLNGQPLTSQLCFPDDRLRGVQLEAVPATPDYPRLSKTADLVSLPLTFYLERKETSVERTVTLRDGTQARVVISGKGFDPYDPELLPGYTMQHNHLVQKEHNRVTDWLIGFGVACAVALLAWGAMAVYRWIWPSETEYEQVQTGAGSLDMVSDEFGAENPVTPGQLSPEDAAAAARLDSLEKDNARRAEELRRAEEAEKARAAEAEKARTARTGAKAGATGKSGKTAKSGTAAPAKDTGKNGGTASPFDVADGKKKQ